MALERSYHREALEPLSRTLETIKNETFAALADFKTQAEAYDGRKSGA